MGTAQHGGSFHASKTAVQSSYVVVLETKSFFRDPAFLKFVLCQRTQKKNGGTKIGEEPKLCCFLSLKYERKPWDKKSEAWNGAW